MKTTIFKYIGLTFFAIGILSFGLSWIYKDKIKKQLLEQANQQVNATIQIEDISLSFIKSFPKIQVELNELKIIGINEFQKDTLANIKEVDLSISLWDYIQSNTIQINSLSIDQAKIHVKVLPNGKANWDITKPATETKSTSKSKAMVLRLESYQIENSDLTYTDQSRNFFTHLKGFQHNGSGNFKGDVFTLNSNTEVEHWDLEFLGKPLLSDVKASLEAPISMNFKKMEFEFSENTLLLNELPIHFSYTLAMPDSTMDMNLSFATEKATLKNFLSLIPSLYAKNFDKLEANGDAKLSGELKGQLSNTHIPGFDIKLNIQNGAFAYQGKAEKIHQLQLNFEASNTMGKIAQTALKLQPFNFKINQETVESNFFIQNPTGDAAIKGNIKAAIQLKDIAQLFPKEGMSYAGNMDANIQFNGKLSELKSGKGKVTGRATIKNFDGKYEDKTIQIPFIESSFSANNLKLKTKFNYLETPFDINGRLENIFGFVLKAEPLTSKIKVNVKELELKKAFDNFQLVQKYLPIAGNLIGNISPSFDFTGTFNKSFDLDIHSVQAEGILKTSTINGNASPIFKQILQIAKWKGANDINLQPANLNFKISDGRLQFKPFNVNSNLGKFAISGSNGLDQSISYLIKTTLDGQKIDNSFGQQLNAQIQKIAPKISLGAIASKIPLEISINGTVSKPTIKIGLSNNANATFKEASKELIKAEIKTQKNKALDDARKKADEEMQKAREMADQLKAKAYAEADKLVEQAGSPIAKFAAKKLADRLKIEADKKVEKILQDAQKRADEMIEKAKSE